MNAFRPFFLRTPKAALLFLVAIGIVIAVLAKLLLAWSTHRELKAELLALVNTPQPRINQADSRVDTDDEHLSELRRIAGMSNTHKAIREAEAQGPSPSLADSSGTDERLKDGGERQPSSVRASDLEPTGVSARTSMDDMVKRAKLHGINVVQSQSPLPMSALEPDVITASMNGTFSALRAWLIDVTDADPHLLLNSAQFRRENRDQTRVTAEIKFVRIEPVAVR